MIDLGKRAVACAGWRWMPGMLCVPIGGGFHVRYNGIVSRNMPDAGGVQYLPVLRDPATKGCVLAMVREACEPNRAPGDWPLVCTYQSATKKWGVGAWLNESGKATFAALVLPAYDTEAAALVAALEAANGA